MSKYTTTLNKILARKPCVPSWKIALEKLGKSQADDEAITFLSILKGMGLRDTIWCMRTAPEFDKEWRLFAVFCARSVEHLLTDPRSIAAVNVAERFAYGTATLEELDLARENAYAAANAANAANASYAAYDNAAYAAAAAAAANASYAAYDAAATANAANASYAAYATCREKQMDYLTELFY